MFPVGVHPFGFFCVQRMHQKQSERDFTELIHYINSEQAHVREYNGK